MILQTAAKNNFSREITHHCADHIQCCLIFHAAGSAAREKVVATHAV
jgi:hypothetical protein